MGEMLFIEPVTGSFAAFGHKYLSPYWGCLTAWGYWFMWVSVGISEITAIGVYAEFWFPDLPQWVSALAAVGLVALANMAAVRLYGELEFWFAMIKVTTIIVMILIGVGLIFFGLGNDWQPIGLDNLTSHGGFFSGGWKGFLFALCIVVASYQGVELVGITAGEAKNPQVTIKKSDQQYPMAYFDFLCRCYFYCCDTVPVDRSGCTWESVCDDFCQGGYCFCGRSH